MRQPSNRVPAILATMALIATMAACGPQSPPVDPLTALRSLGQPLNTSLSAPVTSARLVDSAGNHHTLASLKGKIVVLSDSMTLCQETCPLDTEALVEAARHADAAGWGKKVVFLSLTVDPERDTTTQLASYRQQFTPIPANWLLLTGATTPVHTVLKALGVYVHKVGEDGEVVHNWRTGKLLTYDVEHSDEVFFIDASGRERFVLDGPPQLGPNGKVPPALQKFLSNEGRKNLHDPDPTDWSVPQALKVLKVMTEHR